MQTRRELEISHRGNYLVLEIPNEERILIEKPWHQTRVFSISGKKYQFEPDDWIPQAGKVEIPGYVIRLWYQANKVCGTYEKVDRRLKPENR